MECDLCATLKNPETRCFSHRGLARPCLPRDTYTGTILSAPLGFLLVQRGTEKISYYFKIDLIAGFKIQPSVCINFLVTYKLYNLVLWYELSKNV